MEVVRGSGVAFSSNVYLGLKFIPLVDGEGVVPGLMLVPPAPNEGLGSPESGCAEAMKLANTNSVRKNMWQVLDIIQN
ncbi:MAG: hypothetical protein ACK4FS_09340 [Flavobacterium sp.]